MLDIFKNPNRGFHGASELLDIKRILIISVTKCCSVSSGLVMDMKADIKDMRLKATEAVNYISLNSIHFPSASWSCATV